MVIRFNGKSQAIKLDTEYITFYHKSYNFSLDCGNQQPTIEEEESEMEENAPVTPKKAETNPTAEKGEPALSEGAAELKDFFAPVTPKSVLDDSTKKTPLPPLEGDEQALLDMVEKLDETPALSYEERLKAQGITMNEALVIVDALMVGGVYTKEYAVTKKHVVKFKTRDMEDQGRFIKDLESDSPMYTATTTAMLSRHNLTASLVSFRGSEFKNYEEALAFVVKLPEPIFRILIDKLRKFDMLVFTVMDEGALENF